MEFIEYCDMCNSYWSNHSDCMGPVRQMKITVTYQPQSETIEVKRISLTELYDKLWVRR